MTIEQTAKTLKNDITRSLEPVVGTARNLFLAGLGLVALAKKESEKLLQDSEKALKQLAKEGENLEKTLQEQAKTTVDKVTRETEGRFQRLRQQAEKTFTKAEQLIEKRVEKTMENIGIPTVEDIKKLDKRIADLQKEIKSLNDSQKAA